jgi:glycosyltransferase involved in cell wall biosynthesis
MKKVLIIGMLDSIHLARWLSQFEDQAIMFILFPSKKFRSVHPDLINLVNSNKNYSFVQKRWINFYGYKEFFFNNFLSQLCKRFSSGNRLAKIIKTHNFDYIHALEIQGAGYLLLECNIEKSNESQKIIVTNWGSDIYYFEKNLEDRTKIQKVLKMADYYSAECHRDYELALKNGYLGRFLPINPNAGGFKDSVIQRNTRTSDDRSQIIAKCYGGKFGLGELIIAAMDDYLSITKNNSVFFYSVTKDLEPILKKLIIKYPNRIGFATVRNRLSISDMYHKFANSRIYIGASRSDGISTSFLEALVLGAYPIQTNTSCGNELIQRGFHAHLIEPTKRAIFDALISIDELPSLEELRLSNKALASEFLSFESIKLDSIKFYGVS